jgi:hypothetical protein
MLNNEMNRLFAEGGVMQEGGTVDPVSGNEVPPGAMQEEVRDDIPAQLSEGEFVFPADVVRYIGLETLMKLRDKAKSGLQRMEEIGQMGNAEEVENPEALHGEESEMNDDDFESEIDSIMNDETPEQGFAMGGSVSKGFEVKTLVNPTGDSIFIPYMNGQPQVDVPEGFAEQVQ